MDNGRYIWFGISMTMLMVGLIITVMGYSVIGMLIFVAGFSMMAYRMVKLSNQINRDNKK